jgi:hypothetical protein
MPIVRLQEPPYPVDADQILIEASGDAISLIVPRNDAYSLTYAALSALRLRYVPSGNAYPEYVRGAGPLPFHPSGRAQANSLVFEAYPVDYAALETESAIDPVPRYFLYEGIELDDGLIRNKLEQVHRELVGAVPYRLDEIDGVMRDFRNGNAALPVIVRGDDSIARLAADPADASRSRATFKILDNAPQPAFIDPTAFFINLALEFGMATHPLLTRLTALPGYNLRGAIESVGFTSDFASPPFSIALTNATNRFGDNGDPYPKPEWMRGGRNSPVAHSARARITLDVTLTVEPAGSTFRLVGQSPPEPAPGHLTFELENGPQVSTGASQTVSVIASDALPDGIALLTEPIIWRIGPADGSVLLNAGETGPHKLYVLHDRPITRSSIVEDGQPDDNVLTHKRIDSVVSKIASLTSLPDAEIAHFQANDVVHIAFAVQDFATTAMSERQLIGSTPPGFWETNAPGTAVWGVLDRQGRPSGQCDVNAYLMELALRLLGIDAMEKFVRGVVTVPPAVEDFMTFRGHVNDPVTRECREHGQESLFMTFVAAGFSGPNAGENVVEVNDRLYPALLPGDTALAADRRTAAHNLLIDMERAQRQGVPALKGLVTNVRPAGDRFVLTTDQEITSALYTVGADRDTPKGRLLNNGRVYAVLDLTTTANAAITVGLLDDPPSDPTIGDFVLLPPIFQFWAYEDADRAAECGLLPAQVRPVGDSRHAKFDYPYPPVPRGDHDARNWWNDLLP